MKRIIAILSVVLIFGATSCTKEYDCECVGLNANGQEVAGGTTATVEAKNQDDAREECDEGDTFEPGIGGIDCDLK